MLRAAQRLDGDLDCPVTPGAARAVPCTAASGKPFLKWVGGKGRLLPTLTAMLPNGHAHMRHVEPFVGGGALFFARAPQRALLSDINLDLVQTYRAVRDEVESVLLHLNALELGHDDEAYYTARERFNRRGSSSAAARAALFIYLNKTCFNGLYRVNKRGMFNVPVGRYAKPAIADGARLRAASRGLASAELRCVPFDALRSHARPGDFVYLDPPYEPASDTANFTAYTCDGFTRADQARLRDVFLELDRSGSKLMLSSSDAPVIHELYRGFRVERITALRALNCDPTKRGPVSELVIRNY